MEAVSVNNKITVITVMSHRPTEDLVDWDGLPSTVRTAE